MAMKLSMLPAVLDAALTALHAALSSVGGIVIAVAEIDGIGISAVVFLPPSVRLQGTLAELITTALNSARSSAAADGASGAKAKARLAALEWASARLTTQNRAQEMPRSVPVRLVEAEGSNVIAEVELVQATEVARLVDTFDPRWLAVLLAPLLDTARLLHQTDAWRALVESPRAPGHVHAHLLRKVARQAFGRCQSLLQFGVKTRKKPEVARSPEEMAVEWRAVGALLTLGAKVGERLGFALEAPAKDLIERLTAGSRHADGVPDGAPPPASEEDFRRIDALCAAEWHAAEAAGERFPGLTPEERTERRGWLSDWLDGLAQLEQSPDRPKGPAGPSAGPSSALGDLAAPPLPPPPAPPPAELGATLQQLELSMEPSCVVHACRSGSYMYNLHTPQSDEDYHFVFLSPTRELLRMHTPSDCFKKAVDSPYAADKAGELECTGIEFGRFVELLALGNPGVVELLWLDSAAVGRRGGWVHEAWPWSELVARREKFRTAHCLAQYQGFALDHFYKARDFNLSGDDLATRAKLAKAAYNSFHKLFEARRQAAGKEAAGRDLW